MKKLVPLALLFLLLFSGCGDSGGGSHTGYVTAVETTGWIMQVNRVYFKSDVSSSQEDIYCFDDNEELETSLLEAMNNGEKIEINFHEEVVSAPWRCDVGNVFIDSVAVL